MLVLLEIKELLVSPLTSTQLPESTKHLQVLFVHKLHVQFSTGVKGGADTYLNMCVLLAITMETHQKNSSGRCRP